MSKIITVEFKCETAKLVLDQNYTYQEAAKAMNVSLSAALLNKSEFTTTSPLEAKLLRDADAVRHS